MKGAKLGQLVAGGTAGMAWLAAELEITVASAEPSEKPSSRIARDTLAKRVEVLDPCGDGRTSAELARVATFYKPIRRGAISASLFPDTLTDAKGTFRKPSTW